jgi:perosamine synthetase
MYQFIENLKSDKALYFYRGGVALYALLKSMRIGRGDEVILQSFTCPAVPYPVVHLGATPVYVDIDPGTFNMDPGKIEAKITRKTKALIVQHTYGIPAEMDRILDIARKHDLWVIEDACHALGSKYRGQEVGTFGDAAFYSFGWYKPVVLGVGGAAIVNNSILKPNMEEIYKNSINPILKDTVVLYIQYAAYTLLLSPSWFWFMKEVYRRLRDFRSGPRKGKLGPLIFGHYFGNYLDAQARRVQKSDSSPVTLEESPKLSEQDPLAETTPSEREEAQRIIPFQERRLFRKLDRWNDMVVHQRWIVSRYEELLSQAGYAPFKVGSHFEPVYYKYPLLFARKKEIFEEAQRARIEMSDMFGSPLYPAERAANWKALGYQKGMCPISEDISDRIVALPVHAKIQANEIERTIAFLSFFNNV